MMILTFDEGEDELMAQIAELNNTLLAQDEDDGNYLYRKDEYKENDEESVKVSDSVTEDEYETPDFFDEDDDIIKIDPDDE